MELDRVGRNVDEAGKSASRRAGDIASDVGSRVGEVAHDVRDRAQETAQDVKRRADEAISSVGERMSSAAETLRHSAPSQLHGAAERVASTLDSSGSYLRERTVDDVARDITQIVRQYPLQALCVGIGLGLLFGRSFVNRR